MGLSNDLISQFVKATKDTAKTNNGTTVYGTIVTYNDKNYVRIDGSDLLTPITTTTDTKDGERVTVSIKDHTATVTGNISSPSARTDDVKEVSNKIVEFNTVIAHKITTDDIKAINAIFDKLKADSVNVSDLNAVYAEIETLQAEIAKFDSVSAKDVETINASIENLRATFGKFTDLSTEDLKAINADIDSLKAYTAEFTYVSADKLSAINAEVKKLDTEKLNAKDAEIKYANIDFTNIGKAAMEYFYATSGLIKDVVVGDSTITGELVGVTIKGDLIEGNTVKADKLVVKGEDGLYYKLNVSAGATTSEQVSTEDLQNGLSGSAIIAKTITAEKISIKDLVAFDATIGGFKITNNAIHSGVKESADNNTRGVYMDNSGQFAVGDSSNYLKYYRDSEGYYRLEITAASIRFGAGSKTVEETMNDMSDQISKINIGGRNFIRNSESMIFDNYAFVYAPTATSATTAILGRGVLGVMRLGSGTKLNKPIVRLLDPNVSILDTPVIELYEDKLDTPVIELFDDKLATPVIRLVDSEVDPDDDTTAVLGIGILEEMELGSGTDIV